MKNYEKAYKEALKVMESLYNVVKYQLSSDALLTLQTLKKAFPELCESEDERIREDIIAIFKGEIPYTSEEDAKRYIAWLEKQGEQKPEGNKGNIGKISSNWSEYDQIQLDEAIQMIEANGTWIRSEDAVKKVSNWLKSLKSLKPNHWKPSEEQMQALETAICCRTMPWEKLLTLYNDLKTLKESNYE